MNSESGADEFHINVAQRPPSDSFFFHPLCANFLPRPLTCLHSTFIHYCPCFHSLTMPSFSAAFVALVAATLVGAKPIPQVDVRTGFTINQSIPKAFQAGPVVLMNAYRKFNAPAPSDVQAAASASQGTVTATPEQYDAEYLCPVTIGGQTLNLDFDTGSADLYVLCF